MHAVAGKGLLLATAIVASGAAGAVTWAEREIQDPVGGKPCRITTLASSGSYVYDWPEKYDQVFVPVTAAEGIWFCEGSGFASFIGDDRLGHAERKRIAAFLDRQPRSAQAQPDIAGRLQRAEAIYALRDLTPERNALVHRILAYDFESLAGDPARAHQHRQAALAIMLDRLADESLAQGTRLEYLFVSANYLRESGSAARADRLLAQLEMQIASAGNGEFAAYAAYLQSMLPAARTIAPGGRLAPATNAD
ncbi:hypothetical protein CSC74_06930 [Pseudoxanthomonas yeongjuensis]|uniref:hypothetical protein n=1 Tax=Pseudoxanthomonas yeongjuensis TaxID=377616 RepID=UPI001391976D|nr:hypothetical protein [Pseudoxanthomonas yeongjuensis]KAF1718584.1 hypothetical protein CSC74_06930 [Pseudoxanthomonas yeongjuensis]